MELTNQENAQKGTPLLRCAHSVEPPQELREVVTGGGDLVALVQVLQSSQGGAPHPAGIEHVGKAALDVLTSFAQEPYADP